MGMLKTQNPSKIRRATFFHFNFVFDTINTAMDGKKETFPWQIPVPAFPAGRCPERPLQWYR